MNKNKPYREQQSRNVEKLFTRLEAKFIETQNPAYALEALLVTNDTWVDPPGWAIECVARRFADIIKGLCLAESIEEFNNISEKFWKSTKDPAYAIPPFWATSCIAKRIRNIRRYERIDKVT